MPVFVSGITHLDLNVNDPSAETVEKYQINIKTNSYLTAKKQIHRIPNKLAFNSIIHPAELKPADIDRDPVYKSRNLTPKPGSS